MQTVTDAQLTRLAELKKLYRYVIDANPYPLSAYKHIPAELQNDIRWIDAGLLKTWQRTAQRAEECSWQQADAVWAEADQLWAELERFRSDWGLTNDDNIHTTVRAEIQTDQPQPGEFYTAKQILKACFHDSPDGPYITYMIAISNALFDPTNWKKPFRAVSPACGIEWAKAAAAFYHAGTPVVRGDTVTSLGYQA